MAEYLFGSKVDKSVSPVDISWSLSVLAQWTHEWHYPCVSMIYCDVTNHTKTLGLETIIALRICVV